MYRTMLSAVLLFVCSALYANPYAAHADRAIKALSAEQVEALEQGEGMGMALAAELNGYPGPKHVLELAEPLDLTTEQRNAAQREFDRMQAEAKRLGQEVVSLEQKLDRVFAGGQAQESEIEQISREIGELQGRLRHAHLSAHVAMRSLLSARQLQQYAQLRGYDKAGHDPAHHQGEHQ